MNSREKLQRIIRESLSEVMAEDDEQREVAIATQIKNLADSMSRDQNHPYVKHIQKIIQLADELIKMHGGLQKEVAPKGWEGTVKAMKKHGDIDNPWALAHWMKGKGMKSHK